MIPRSAAIGLLLAASLPRGGAAQEPTTTAAAFVRNFYSWYLPVAKRQHWKRAYYQVLKHRPNLLSPDLRIALVDDTLRKAVYREDVKGIDFDPFLSTQEPCARYEVVPAADSAGASRMDVFAVCGGRRAQVPTATVVVGRYRGRWVISNVEYLDRPADLIAILVSYNPD